VSDSAQLVSRSIWARAGKRWFDAGVSGLLLLLFSPVLLLSAILVRLSSPGPVFFTQARAGRGGHRFVIYKFRTMRGGRKPDPKELVPLDHAEITRIGWWLRRLKIDELPQLWNVLRGDMSLVGPRPTLPDQVEAYDDFRRQRLLLRPGISGLAQVHGNTAISWDERILYDIAYVRRCSLLLDVRILLRTVLVVVGGEARNPVAFGKSAFAGWVEVPVHYGSADERR
jgi:lipopolysaccharide/colanic/teichoic acid biosynthesis glycosyltransferase